MSGFCFCLKLSEPLEIEDGVKSVPSEYCHTIWCVKSRMIWLPDGEELNSTQLKSLRIRLLVLTEFTNVGAYGVSFP